MFSHVLFTSSSSSEFSKAANLFVISIWYCSLTSGSFSFLQVYWMPSTSFIPSQYSFQHRKVLHTWKHPPPLPLKQTVYLRLLNLKYSLYSLQTGNCWYVTYPSFGYVWTNSDHYVNSDTIILGIKWTRKVCQLTLFGTNGGQFLKRSWVSSTSTSSSSS